MRAMITLATCLLFTTTGQLHGDLVATTWSGTGPSYTGTFAGGTVTATVVATTSNITTAAAPAGTFLPLGIGEVITGLTTGTPIRTITLDLTGTTFGTTDALFIGNINTESPISCTYDSRFGRPLVARIGFALPCAPCAGIVTPVPASVVNTARWPIERRRRQTKR